MSFRTHARVAAVLLLGQTMARAQVPPTPVADQEPAIISPWTVDDVVMQERAGSWALSRDGRRALWIRSKPDKKKDRHVSTLMLTDLETGRHRSVTTGQSGISAPRFSPSGRFVSFSSDRKFPEGQKELPKDEKGSQLWVLDLEGGEARLLTRVAHGVGPYQWHDDETIFLLARERRSRAESVASKDKDDTIVVEDLATFHERGRRLFRFGVKSRKLERVTRNIEPMESFQVSPDGKFVFATLSRSPSYRAEGLIPPRVVVYDLEDGRETELFSERKSKPGSAVWRHDSKGFFVPYPKGSVDGEDWGSILVLKEVSVPGFAIRDIDLSSAWGMTRTFQVTTNGFIAGLCNGARPKLARYTRQGEGYVKAEIEGDHAGRISSMTVSRDSDRIIYVHGGASDPDHVVSARLDGNVIKDQKEIHRPNKGFRNKPLARTEIIRWQGALDEQVEGILYYPHDYTEGKRHPLVLITHGGPHGADRDRFGERYANSPNLYCQRGAFVLKTNYHGSSDYGLAFGESIKGRYYEHEVKDMFTGIKKLVDDGLVDPEQMGLVGWSNGAILSIAALTLGHLYAPGFDWKFKACAPGAGDVNWTSDYGNCAFGASFDEFYLGATPWSAPELYVRKSPLFHVERVSTPTIIFFGTKDTSVPTEQGWEWYRALHRVKKAPVRFLLFPGQPHGLGKLTHRKRKLSEELAWFDKYMFDDQQPLVDIVKNDSPLAVAMDVAAYPRAGDHFGVEIRGVLAPETVPMGTCEVGRFEVTRAQWQAFDGSLSVAPGEGNHPYAGITLARARDYVSWLAERTGEPYRLLTDGEWRKLASASGSRENTLDAWAGYKPRLEEAAVLRKELEKLGWRTALLPVGSRPPGLIKHGGRERRVFDVGGNVAELVLGSDGEALVRGGCAVMSPDARAKDRKPPRDWTGFRIAKGPAPRAADAGDQQR